MSFITDIRAVSEGALAQLAGRFSDLPRPLLAAIGAGDMAVEQLAELREKLSSGSGFSTPDLPDLSNMDELAGNAKEFAADLPAMAQKVAAGVVESVEQFADQAPAKAQKLVADLPAKLAEIRGSLSQDQLKESVEAYTQLAAMLYGSLAERGDKTWTKVVSAAGVDTKVVDAEPTGKAAEKIAEKAEPAAAKPAAAKPAAAKAPAEPAVEPAAAKPAAKPATAKAAAKPAAKAKTDEPVDAAAKVAAGKTPASKIAAKPTPAEEAAALEAVKPVRKAAARKSPAPKPATRVMAAPKKEPVVEVHPTPEVG